MLKPPCDVYLLLLMKEIFGDIKRPVQRDDLIRMRYCEAAINKTARVYPAGAFLFRVADLPLCQYVSIFFFRPYFCGHICVKPFTNLLLMFLLAVLVCAAVVCAHTLLWLRARRARALLAGLPTYPINLPFLGNLLYAVKDSPNVMPLITHVAHTSEAKGLPFVGWVGTSPAISIIDSEDIKAVSNAFVEKPYYYGFSRLWLGNGLITATGVAWKHNIKILAGTFSSNALNGFQDVFNAQAARLVRQLSREAGAEPFDALHQYLSYTTLETICQFCVPDSSKGLVSPEYYKAFYRVLELIIQRIVNIFLHVDSVYRISPAYREFKSCTTVLENLSQTAITKRRKGRYIMKINGTLHKSEPENGNKSFKPFVDTLLELSESDPTMTERQIREEVDTFIAAGQDTVAITLHMTLLMIGSHSDVQEKLYTEMREIFGDSKRPVQKEDLTRMRYCEAVICETLRLYPPVPAVIRLADRELELKSCTIPKGTSCVINIWGAGRSKRAWGPDAEQFRPERWLKDKQSTENSPSSFAFSFGKRACIGKRYAFDFLKIILAHCVRELVIVSEAEKLQLQSAFTLKPVKGHFLQVHLREN